MAKLLRLRRGTDTQHTTFTGAEGEVTVNTTNDSLHVHDGTTAGGREIRADVIQNGTSNVSVAASGDITVTRAGSTVGQFLSTGVHVNDNVKFTAGTGQDLEIYHDGSNSRITESGTGHLIIAGTQLYLNNSANSQSYFSGSDGGSANLYYAGTSKLATTSTGIDVTGTVTCDGLTCEGDALISSGTSVLKLRDSDSTGAAVGNYIRGEDSTGAARWYAGQLSGSSEAVYITNAANAAIFFGTNDTTRIAVQSDGHFVPQANNTYDLGTSSLQWRDAWFDGTVNCDGLTSEGNIELRSSFGSLYVKDSDNNGTASQCQVAYQTADNTVLGQVGYIDSANSHLYVRNAANGYDIIFQTNGTNRVVIDSNGHLVPNASNTYDLGTSSLRWRNVYTNDLNLSNEGGANDVDGTWGSWTIQEGEDDLFLLNRRNGKKYKFNLSEVN